MDNVLYLLAFAIPLLFLGIIRKFDFFQVGQFPLIVICVCWGAIIYAPAALTNWSLVNLFLAHQNTVDHFIAPILEELLKGLILFYLVRRSQFTYSVDGVLYGFAVGIGFAIFENFENVSQTQSIIEIFLRIFSTNLVHAFSSAAIGMSLGIFKLGASRFRWLVSVVGVLVAIGQHMVFNIMGLQIPSLIKVIPGVPGMVFIYIVMQYGKKQAQTWIKEKLGMIDRVTRGEVDAINRLATSDDVLLPVYERFGAEKADQVEKLLFLQARLGIKRKSLDSIQNNSTMRNAVETEIREMQNQMEKVRREIGAYTMLFVRGLFTEEMISVWDQIQVKIQERSAETGGQKGGGLWSSLDERLNESKEDKRSE